MTQLAIILGSTRPGRRIETVGRWVLETAGRHPAVAGGEASVALVDIADYELPGVQQRHPRRAENAIDYLWAEWNHKAAGIVSYGLYGGTRAAEQLRQTMAEVKIADVHLQVAINPFVDFDFTESGLGVCASGERHEGLLSGMLDEILEWSRALRTLRDPTASTDPVRPE